MRTLSVFLFALFGLKWAIHAHPVQGNNDCEAWESSACLASHNFGRNHGFELPFIAANSFSNHTLPAGEWAKAFGATAVISIFPTLILPFIPLVSFVDGVPSLHEDLHRLLLSFATGGLLGEVFLHSLPHLLERHDHFGSSHGHHHHSVGTACTLDKTKAECCREEQEHHEKDGVRGDEGEALRVSMHVLAGFLLFFISEKVVKLLLGEEDGGHIHGHNHGKHTTLHINKGMVNGEIEGEREEEMEQEEQGEEEEDQDWSDSHKLRRRSPRIRERYSNQERRQMREAAAAAGGTNGGHGMKALAPTAKRKDVPRLGGCGRKGTTALKSSGYLNVVIDVLHNLTDGVAIGASFASGHGVGVATTISVFLHEIPHEIGDFAILVQSGLSVQSAFLLQFCTAVAAFIGTLLGLVAKRQEGLERLVLALTTGGFLYVATVSVLPELLAGKPGGAQSLREVGGVVGGIGLMAWVALGEAHAH